MSYLWPKMPYIRTYDLENADTELRAAYEQIIGSRGKLAEVHKIQSLNPPALLAHMDLYKAIMFSKSPLKRYQREMVAVIVSAANKCPYCIEHHRQALLFYWKDEDRADALIRDFTTADITEAEKALCAFARHLTLQPGQTDAAGVEALRRHGWDDRAILDTTQVIAYFNFVNRIVLGLGVSFNAEEASGYHY